METLKNLFSGLMMLVLMAGWALSAPLGLVSALMRDDAWDAVLSIFLPFYGLATALRHWVL